MNLACSQKKEGLYGNTQTAPQQGSLQKKPAVNENIVEEKAIEDAKPDYIIEVGDRKCFKNLDIVFTIDVSTSMSFVLAKLEEQIADVWQAAEELEYQAQFGLVVFVDDVRLVSRDPISSVSELQEQFRAWYYHTQSNHQPSSFQQNLDFPENSLDALVTAAQDFNWRAKESTTRIIYHLTDDTFLERGQYFANGLPARSSYQETLSTLKENQIKTAIFARKYQQGITANPGSGFFTSLRGQPSIPEATDGAVFDIDQINSGFVSLGDSLQEFYIEKSCI